MNEVSLPKELEGPCWGAKAKSVTVVTGPDSGVRPPAHLAQNSMALDANSERGLHVLTLNENSGSPSWRRKERTTMMSRPPDRG